jgi:hypothetical protein
VHGTLLVHISRDAARRSHPGGITHHHQWRHHDAWPHATGQHHAIGQGSREDRRTAVLILNLDTAVDLLLRQKSCRLYALSRLISFSNFVGD